VNRRAPRPKNPTLAELRDEIQRASVEFVALPLWIVLGFLLLAVGAYWLDHSAFGWLEPIKALPQRFVFASADATSELLGIVAASLITVTSITFSLLLIAVQQSAALMTAAVLDQYLRRRTNQVVFGFFVGLALYALVILSTVDPPYNPIIGASLALVLMIVALALLPLLLYTTLDQMRPAVILEAIHDHTLAARLRQYPLLRRTRRAPLHAAASRLPVEATEDGFVVRIDLDAIDAALRQAPAATEIILQVVVGSYVSYRQPIAEIQASATQDLAPLQEVIRAAVHLQRQRDLDGDPAFGIQQMATIAWTSISTSKQDPAPGLLTVYAFRDLLARWADEDLHLDQPPDERPVPVVYADEVHGDLLDAMESLLVVSTESMQHHIFAESLRTFALLLPRLSPARQGQVEGIVRRALAGLGDHVLTADLDRALATVACTMAAQGRRDTAAAIQQAQAGLHQAVGKLNSRATRVPRAG
jgi:hypothetical protein